MGRRDLIYPFPRNVVDELAVNYPLVSLVEQPSGGPLNCVDVTGGKRLLDLMQKRFGDTQHILLECDLHEGATPASVRV